MDFTIIDLEWEGFFKVDYDRINKKYLIDSIPGDLLKKNGFYQIYGRHPVYGNDVLLYIGETSESEKRIRSFRDRLKEHLGGRFFDHTNLSISLAPYKGDTRTIKEIESVLIWAHKPALNRQHIDSRKECENHFLIRNWYFLGSLNECCTSYWD